MHFLKQKKTGPLTQRGQEVLSRLSPGITAQQGGGGSNVFSGCKRGLNAWLMFKLLESGPWLILPA